MANINKDELTNSVSKILFKLTEIRALLREGKIIVGAEKLDGVIKNVSALGARLQQSDDIDEENAENPIN